MSQRTVDRTRVDGVEETLPRSDMKEEMRGRQLRRLEVFIDVVFALVFFRIIHYLPATENMEWVGKPYGVLQPLVDDPVQFVRIFIGLGLTLIYWQQSARFLKTLKRTDETHAALQLIQLIFVCLFMYFVISDPRLAGGPSSPALQSGSLVLAGFAGLAGWVYARRHDFVAGEVTQAERDQISRSGLVDPVTALLTIPLAFVGPLIWTAGWLVLPFLVRRMPDAFWTHLLSWGGLWTLLKVLVKRV